jgi:D-sedoheptulose 7-phosphate isomerase
MTKINIDSVESHFDDYVKSYNQCMMNLDKNALKIVKALMRKTIDDGNWIYFCGNGGSAEISNHMECDHLKGISSGTTFKPKINSLSNGIGLITAIANDISYEDIFSFRIDKLCQKDDLLVAISSSGKSQNIINAIKTANEIGMNTISLTGFSGGEARTSADLNLHLDSDNYGVIEDGHQSILHILAQALRVDGLESPNTTIL